MEPRDIFLLEAIVEYCDRITNSIEKHGDDFKVFDKDLEYQDFCAFRIIQIGEYVSSLSKGFKEQYGEMPWRSIVGLRNILTHDYGKISNIKFWGTLKKDVPVLRDFCVKQLNNKAR